MKEGTIENNHFFVRRWRWNVNCTLLWLAFAVVAYHNLFQACPYNYWRVMVGCVVDWEAIFLFAIVPGLCNRSASYWFSNNSFSATNDQLLIKTVVQNLGTQFNL